MKSEIEYHPLVEADATEAAVWYEAQQPGLSDRFVDEYLRVLRTLPRTALIYAVRFGDIRRVNLPSFPYGVFYFLTGEQIVVLGVLHGAREIRSELERRRTTFG